MEGLEPLIPTSRHLQIDLLAPPLADSPHHHRRHRRRRGHDHGHGRMHHLGSVTPGLLYLLFLAEEQIWSWNQQRGWLAELVCRREFVVLSTLQLLEDPLRLPGLPQCPLLAMYNTPQLHSRDPTDLRLETAVPVNHMSVRRGVEQDGGDPYLGGRGSGELAEVRDDLIVTGIIRHGRNSLKEIGGRVW